MSTVTRAHDVLATMRDDGSRRTLRPRLAHGRYLNRRRVIGYALIAIFVSLPFVRIGGRPGMRIDIPGRELDLAGAIFHATDTAMLMLFMLGVLTTVFLTTAIAGRAWCGYACPQTVYLELVFRPIERLIEGRAYSRGNAGPARLALKYAIYVVLAVLLANVFVAYFVGSDALFASIQRSPGASPGPFAAMAFTSVLVFADFAWFREQMCSVACPYARLQSALVDPKSAIIAYDSLRGEPRAAPRDRKGGTFGDCVDCSACVAVCPAGIDIRKGLQLECIACAQCADACDVVMRKRGLAERLVGYTMPSAKAALMRPRVWIYSVMLIGIAVGLTVLGRADRTLDVSVLASTGTPYLLINDDTIGTPLRLRLTNQSVHERGIALTIDGGELVISENPVRLGPGETRTLSMMVRTPRRDVASGTLARTMTFSENGVVHHTEPVVITGPVGSRQ
jgi:cytochrome c oxidase accessory protein FixG